MHALGQHLASTIVSDIPPQHAINLVCTVEDADFLAKGIFETLCTQFERVNLTCFWNHRQKVGTVAQAVSFAPVFRSYIEPVQRIDTLIISGACVVKTNLTDMLEKFTPRQIFILAPVMHKDAEDKLKAVFSADIVERFHFYSFAIDHLRDADGTVHPGIGGNVYQRLGFKGQDDKNRYTPQLVKSRREQVLA